MTTLAGLAPAESESLAGVSFEALEDAARSAVLAQNLAAATRLEVAHRMVEQFAEQCRLRDECDRQNGRRRRPAYARLAPADRARDHLSAALTLTTWHAARLVAAGVQVHTRLPRLRKAVARGIFPEQLAVDAACRLAEVADELIASVEAEVVTSLARDLSGGHRPSRTALDSLVDDAVERRDPKAAREIADAAEETRNVRFRTDRHGMARLWARLPVADAELLRGRIYAEARAAAGDGVPGTLDQLRADALTGLASYVPTPASTAPVAPADHDGVEVVDAVPGADLPRANLGAAAVAAGEPIRITVIAGAVQGLPNRVEFVHGAYCSFDWLCRELLDGEDAQVRFEAVDPAPGALDAPERALRYLLTPAMVERIRLRDGTCRHPGCTVASHDCDIDHVLAFDKAVPEFGGPSAEWNLMCLCRKHHREKTFGTNSYRPGPLGELIIVTPTGTEFRTRPTGPLARARDQIREQAWNAHIDRLIADDGHLANPPGAESREACH